MRSVVAVLFLSCGFAHADKVTLVAGGGKGGVDGPANQAAIGQPFGLDFDKTGNMFIADYKDDKVWKVDTKGVLTVYAGTGKRGFAGDGGPATEGQFNAMHDLIVAENGDVFIADSFNFRVRKIDAKTGKLSTVVGTGEKKTTGDGGPGEKAGLDGVASLYFNADQSKMYMTGFSTVVRVLDMKTGIVETVKNLPGGRSVAVDATGQVYVAGGTTLRVLKKDGSVETLHDSTKAKADEVKIGKNTKHLGVDAEGNILICDDFGHQIKKYVVKDKKLVVLAGTGKKGSKGIDGPADKVELNAPHGVFFRRTTKEIYICDSMNNRVLKIVKE
jgi:DNA-binding beta-propeller fold protein YncE